MRERLLKISDSKRRDQLAAFIADQIGFSTMLRDVQAAATILYNKASKLCSCVKDK